MRRKKNSQSRKFLFSVHTKKKKWNSNTYAKFKPVTAVKNIYKTEREKIVFKERNIRILGGNNSVSVC